MGIGILSFSETGLKPGNFCWSTSGVNRFLLAILLFFACKAVQGAEPSRYAPAPGISVPGEIQAELQNSSANLGSRIEALRQTLRTKPGLLALLPDVEIFHKAVEWPLVYGEFYRSNDFGTARNLIKQGLERANALGNGQAPWMSATGLVIRGYVSKIDQSVQPYGLVVPASFRPDSPQGLRLDVWLHGRDDHLTELKFVSDRQRSSGEFAPRDAFVLHPYGRFCNAFKFAGEMDVLEAMQHVQNHYPVDASRRTIRGFSMGGAGCWHLAVHHPGLWTAAAPGAGFAETAIYTRALSKNPPPPWYEQTLWHLYDSIDYARNLFNCPTVAYSGEIDPQKQAADMMSAAMKREGLDLVHVIGPNTPHRYEPRAKLEVANKVDALLEKPKDLWPEEVRFTTWSLRYPESHWVKIERMQTHWRRATVDARMTDHHGCVISTTNVAELTVGLLESRMGINGKLPIEIDGQIIAARGAHRGDVRTVRLRRKSGQRSQWGEIPIPVRPEGKRPGLQGPIDDAFMDTFLMVRPTGQPMDLETAKWIEASLGRATNEWRSQFRGLPRIKNDIEITLDDIAANNLILWGDPKSNKLLGRIAKRLPMTWNDKVIRLHGKDYNANGAVPILIYPNPLNRDRYVVLNTGFTFADRGAASNAQQTPKLPDWALLGMTPNPREAVGSYGGGSILDAGFFDESWQMAVK